MNREAFVKSFFEKFNEDEALPLLTLEEFFSGNTEEDSIAPNQWGYGRPTLAEMLARFQELESRTDVAWVRVVLHDDTSEDMGICGDCLLICTSASIEEMEQAADTDWLCSDGAIDYEEDETPPIPKNHHLLAIVWD
ncbi:MAG: hypothetical protein LBV04_01575 [Deferribacteraceae bacterium]|jgi:hypothetical protein|nr:hypothetical protein [Deferribacteraceae bacterium]